VLASGWFFPVSCTAGLFAGTRIVAKLDARDVSRGDSVHNDFSIVMESAADDEPFQVVSLDDMNVNGETLNLSGTEDGVSFLMSNPGGQIDYGSSNFSYQVIEETDAGQVIEVVEAYDDGDNTIWSRYEATRSSVTPISSRMFYFGYMFAAGPYALGLALFLYASGRYLQHRNQRPAPAT
jgi:hypothetical protein